MSQTARIEDVRESRREALPDWNMGCDCDRKSKKMLKGALGYVIVAGSSGAEKWQHIASSGTPPGVPTA